MNISIKIPNLNRATLIKLGKQQNVNPKAYPLGSRPGKSAPSFIYDSGKNLARYYGYYQDIRPYLPEERIKDIRQKPVATSLAFQRIFTQEKSRFSSKACRLDEKRQIC